MKKLSILLFAIGSSFCLLAQNGASDSIETFSLFRHGNSFIDLKFVDPAKGTFGVDYRIDLKRTLATLGNDYRNLNFAFSSNGFMTVAEDKNQINSIINEMKFEAFPLTRIKPRRRVYTGGRDWRDVGDDTTATPDNDSLINDVRSIVERVSSPFYLFFNIHGKHETTQNFNDHDIAIGAQLSFTTSFLNALLDFPVSLLRYGKNNNPRHLDISIGYDYVSAMQATGLAPLLNGANAVNRLNFKGEWETGIFSGRDRLVLLFDSYRILNPTQQLKNANKAWNTFFMAKIEHILSQNVRTSTRTKVAIKYTKGELPPNFLRGHVLGAGFSLEF